MVVAPKYKHYDGINFAGETRVRVKDQEAPKRRLKVYVCILGERQVLAPAQRLWGGIQSKSVIETALVAGQRYGLLIH